MLISDAVRNVDWDACQVFQNAAGERCFGIICEDKDDLITILAEAIDFNYDQEGGDTQFVKLLLSGEETHTEGGCSTKVWPTVAWDDPWDGEGRTVQWESTGHGAMAWGGCNGERTGGSEIAAEAERCFCMDIAQYTEDMNLMEEEETMKPPGRDCRPLT